MLISIVFLRVTGNDYDIFVNNYIFSYLLQNILILLAKFLAILHLRQSEWEDKVTATKIRGALSLTKTLLREGLHEWINDANFLFLCVAMVICHNG